MLELFQRMGRTLQERWSARRFDRDAFPEEAARVLRELQPHARVTELEVLRWVATADPFPQQENLDATFGQPPITLFRNEAFSISALCWIDGTTAIHQHSFSGAFSVLSGSSIHATYGFEVAEPVNVRLRTGRVRLRDVALLQPGDVHPIRAGDRFIHCLFHLDRPTVSLVARTHHDPGTEPQLSYLKPGIAVDPFHRPPWLRRMKQVLTAMIRVGHEGTREVAADALRCCGPFEAVELLRRVDGEDPTATLLRPLADVARERFPELMDAAMPALLYERENRLLVARRRALHDPELRYFLALLLNVPTRERVLELVAARRPDDDPVRVVMGWIDELRGWQLPGEGGEPTSVLGMDLDDADLWVIDRMLRGRTEAAILRELEDGGEGVPEGMTAARAQKLLFTLPFTSVFGPLTETADEPGSGG